MTIKKSSVNFTVTKKKKLIVMAKIQVKDTEITVMKVNDEDFLCLTDMLTFRSLAA